MATRVVPRRLFIDLKTPEEVELIKAAKKAALEKEMTLREFVFAALREHLTRLREHQPPTSKAA